MLDFCKKLALASRVPVGVLSAVTSVGLMISVQAQAAVKEITLASPAQALAYCKAGNMMPADIAYFAGAGGLAQYGSKGCPQQVPPSGTVANALGVKGKNKVLECKMVSAAQALKFCNSGAMGTYDIDYISGKVGRTLSGPGYGCVVNYSSVSLGNAVCK